MARFCTECGKEIAAGVAFCTECGAKAPAEAQAVPGQKPLTQAFAQPRPQVQTFAQPQNSFESPAIQMPRNGSDEVVKTGSYFGLLFLFGIPVLGLLISIVVAFAAKNRNRKNLAKAMIIWNLIGLLLAGLLVLAIHLLSGPIMDFVNDQLGGILGELGGEGGIGGMLEQFGEYREILELLKNGNLEGLDLEGLDPETLKNMTGE